MWGEGRRVLDVRGFILCGLRVDSMVGGWVDWGIWGGLFEDVLGRGEVGGC